MPRRNRLICAIMLMGITLLWATSAHARARWSEQQASTWQQDHPWLVGANFAPGYAINQLEMWQADTFDPAAIDRELALAESLGFNSMRVFLHHLLWEQDSKGFLQRMEKFLEVADKHHIGVMFVLFDSCWDPNPKLGKQREPQKGVHNSGWVQSPGAADLTNPARHALLKEYTQGVIGHFKNDKRVHVWDIWNEPDNLNDNSYGKNKLKQEPPKKVELTLELLKQSFEWAREVDPSQPITSGVWIGTWPDANRLSPTERTQLDQSDIITFHSYAPAAELKKAITNLRRYNRPIVCTEYMARPQGSTFDANLGLLKEEKVGAYNWGFMAGKTNTLYPWDSWQKPYDTEPKVWFHEIFKQDGTPYDEKEVAYIRKVTGKASQ